MGLTVIQNDVFASQAGSAKGAERVEALTAANSTNGNQERKIFSDEQGFLLAVGRGSDGITTFLRMRNSDGEDCFIFPNATQNGITVQSTAP